MKILGFLLVFVSLQASAQTLTCGNKYAGADDRSMIVELKKGSFELSMYETFGKATGNEFSSVVGRSFEGSVDTIVGLIDNKTLNMSSEGEEYKATVTASLVYNPKVKAARLTLIIDGKTVYRNALLEKCSLN